MFVLRAICFYHVQVVGSVVILSSCKDYFSKMQSTERKEEKWVICNSVMSLSFASSVISDCLSVPSAGMHDAGRGS